MKRLVVFFAVLLFISGMAVHAQDLIILRDGSVIEAQVTEISPSEIRYKRSSHLDGPTIVVPAVNVLSIRYANGKVDIINAASASAGGASTGGAGAGASTGGVMPGGLSLLQDALNMLPAIPVAGKTFKFLFAGETWRAQVNGADALSGTLTFQTTAGGGVIILKPTHTYLQGKQISTPGAEIFLEYKEGAGLRALSKKEQQAVAQQQPAAVISTRPGPDNAVSWTGNGHKYLVVDQSMTWDKANAYAQEQGGYLATITSKEKQEFIEDLLAIHGKSNNYWLGGSRVGKKWQWSSGESWGYTNWMSGEPNNANGKENKLMLARVAPPGKGSAKGKWNDSQNNDTGWGSFGLIIEWNE